MDIMSATDFYGEMECVANDENFNDIFSDFETFSDSHSESDFSDFGNLDNIQESMIFDWSNEAYMNNLNNNNNETVQSKSLCYLEPSKPSSPSSPFDTNNFPTSVNDISNLIEIEPNFKFESIYMADCNSLEVSYDISVPVIKVEEPTIDDDTNDEEKDEEDQISVEKHLLHSPEQRHQRKYSSTDESDEEWAPEPPKYFRKREPGLKRISKAPSRRPVPQRRSPGTKLKITQWIVELLRNPKYNPKVITWIDEKQGVFMIKDTATYAKLWGKVKMNSNMTYEKLSRAMRYSYKNDELRMVPEQRLTYQFGANMVNFRAEDSADPNFELLHKNKA